MTSVGWDPRTAGKLGATSECEGSQPRLGGRSPPYRQSGNHIGRGASRNDVAFEPHPE